MTHPTHEERFQLIRDLLNAAAKRMPRDDYGKLLEEISDEVEARLQALRDDANRKSESK